MRLVWNHEWKKSLWTLPISHLPNPKVLPFHLMYGTIRLKMCRGTPQFTKIFILVLLIELVPYILVKNTQTVIDLGIDLFLGHIRLK